MNKRIKKHLPCGLYDIKGQERQLDLYADILLESESRRTCAALSFAFAPWVDLISRRWKSVWKKWMARVWCLTVRRGL